MYLEFIQFLDMFELQISINFGTLPNKMSILLNFFLLLTFSQEIKLTTDNMSFIIGWYLI